MFCFSPVTKVGNSWKILVANLWKIFVANICKIFVAKFGRPKLLYHFPLLLLLVILKLSFVCVRQSTQSKWKQVSYITNKTQMWQQNVLKKTDKMLVASGISVIPRIWAGASYRVYDLIYGKGPYRASYMGRGLIYGLGPHIRCWEVACAKRVTQGCGRLWSTFSQ
jgi:hypothetical protein